MTEELQDTLSEGTGETNSSDYFDDAAETCREHGEDFDYFCNTCVKRVCEECVKAEHKDHKWTMMKTFVRKAKENSMRNYENIRHEIIPSLQAKGNTPINAMRNKLKNVVDEYADSLLTEMESLSGNENANTLRDIETMESFAVFFQTLIHTADDKTVMEKSEEFHAQKLQLGLRNKIVEFKEGTIDVKQIQEMFGHIKKSQEICNHSISTVTVTGVTTVNYGNSSMFHIAPVTTKEAWIHCGTEKEVHLVNKTGESRESRKTMSDFSDFVFWNKDIIVTDFMKKVIRRISPSGDVTIVCSTAQFRPRALCLSGDGRMLVGVCDSYICDISPASAGKVKIMTVSGHKHTVYKMDHLGRKLFINPYRIARNINNDLCVVDIIDRDQRSRLVVITSEEKFRFTYTGQPSMKEKLVAGDVCCDRHGHIILSDLKNNAIHMLNFDGQFIQYLMTKDEGLHCPRSVAIYEDTLWIGCDNGVVKILELK